jgi:hypothetical protein
MGLKVPPEMVTLPMSGMPGRETPEPMLAPDVARMLKVPSRTVSEPKPERPRDAGPEPIPVEVESRLSIFTS